LLVGHYRDHILNFITNRGMDKVWDFKLRLFIPRYLMVSRFCVGIKSAGWPISRILTVNVTAIIGFLHRGDIRLFDICPWPLLADLSNNPLILSCWWGLNHANPASTL
jgi:hypothetical protein